MVMARCVDSVDSFHHILKEEINCRSPGYRLPVDFRMTGSEVLSGVLMVRMHYEFQEYDCVVSANGVTMAPS